MAVPPAQAPVPRRARVALAVAMLAVSSGAIFARLADCPALAKGAWRAGVAAAVVLPVALWLRGAEWRSLTRTQWLLACLAGAMLALHFATWIASLDHTSVAASVLLVNTYPAWVAVLAPWLTGDRLGRRGWAGLALSLAGMALAASAGPVADAEWAFPWHGNLLALAGGLFGALYLMLGRRVRRSVGVLTYVALTYTAAAVVLWLLVAVTGTRAWGFGAGTWAALLGMAFISQHLGHSGYNYALRFLSPSLLAVTLLSEPVLCSLGAWAVFGEVPPLRLLPAAALLLPGIWLVSRDQAAPEQL